jgi:lysophospholipase L1-like esterase
MRASKSTFNRVAVRLVCTFFLLATGTIVAQPATEIDPMELATTPAPLTESWAIEWWMPRHEEKLAARDSGVELVLIGDSITHGWENEGRAVWARYFGDVATLNLGFSGDRTENVLWRLQHGEVDGLAPKLVVLMIGTNNTGHRMDPPEAIAAGVRAILEELERRLPDRHVLLLAIFPRGATADDPQRANNRATNALLKQIAAETDVEFADFNDDFLEESGRLSTAIMPDLLHPNETGYQIWARQLEPFVDERVRDGVVPEIPAQTGTDDF